MPEEKTILFKLFEASRTCSDVDMRTALQRKSRELKAALTDLYHSPTETNAQRVTGLWAAGERLLKNMKPEASPGGTAGGLQEGALLAQAA